MLFAVQIIRISIKLTSKLVFDGDNFFSVFFSSTLYVGTHTHGLYALPALATSDSTVLLLNGPSLSSDDTISVPMVNEDEESTAVLGKLK